MGCSFICHIHQEESSLEGEKKKKVRGKDKKFTCKERLSMTFASQNVTKAKYARRRPASYLSRDKRNCLIHYIYRNSNRLNKSKVKLVTRHQQFQRLSFP